MFWRGGGLFWPFFVFLALFLGRGVGGALLFWGAFFFQSPFFGALFFRAGPLFWFFFLGGLSFGGPFFRALFLGPFFCFGFSWEAVLGWKYRLRKGPKTKGPKRGPQPPLFWGALCWTFVWGALFGPLFLGGVPFCGPFLACWEHFYFFCPFFIT